MTGLVLYCTGFSNSTPGPKHYLIFLVFKGNWYIDIFIGTSSSLKIHEISNKSQLTLLERVLCKKVISVTTYDQVVGVESIKKNVQMYTQPF